MFEIELKGNCKKCEYADLYIRKYVDNQDKQHIEIHCANEHICERLENIYRRQSWNSVQKGEHEKEK